MFYKVTRYLIISITTLPSHKDKLLGQVCTFSTYIAKLKNVWRDSSDHWVLHRCSRHAYSLRPADHWYSH